MKGVPCVVKAEYRGGHRIHVTFDDGCEKTIDFRQWLKGPVFAPLKDLKYFRRFFLDGWTVAWPNGADVAPEALYESLEAGTERGPACAPPRKPRGADRRAEQGHALDARKAARQ